MKIQKAKTKASVQGSGSSVQVAGVGKATSSKRSKTARGDADDRHRRPTSLNGAKGHLCPTKDEALSPGRRSTPSIPAKERQRLVEILESFEISVQGFEGLRADAYEKQLAARSLQELENFYEMLADPGRGYKRIAQECPYRDLKSKERPHWTTIKNIKQRIQAERQVEDVGRKLTLIRQTAEQMAGLSLPEKSMILNALLASMGAELMGLKQEGKLVIENLPVVDRIIKAVGVKARVEQTAERNRIDEQVRNGRLELDREKFEWYKAGQPITEPEVPPEANDGTQPMIDGRTRPSDEDGTDDIIERIYGPNPFKTKPVDPNAKPYLQVVDPASDQPKPAWWTPGTVLIAGPSQKYPKGVRRHVVSGNPHCVATMICVDVESEEFRAIYDETGSARASAEGGLQSAESNKSVQCSVSSVQNPSAQAPDGNNKEGEDAKAKAETKSEDEVSKPVETLEEYMARKKKEAEQKAWEARQMRIRDKPNGTEHYFYPPGYGPNN